VLRLDANDGELQAAGDTMSVRIGAASGVAVPAGVAAWWPANGEVHEVVHGNHDVEFLPRAPRSAPANKRRASYSTARITMAGSRHTVTWILARHHWG